MKAQETKAKDAQVEDRKDKRIEKEGYAAKSINRTAPNSRFT